MINQQLINYINEQNQQGVSQGNIRVALRANGWSEEDLDQAFKSLPPSSTPTVSQMPVSSSVSSKKTLLILLGLVFLVIVGAIVFFVLRSGSDTVSDLATQPIFPVAESPKDVASVESTTTQTETTETQKIKSPSEVYLEMEKGLDSVKNFDDFVSLTTKYSTKKNIEKMKAEQDKIDAVPAESKQAIIDFMMSLVKMVPYKDIIIDKETINGDTATLELSSVKPGPKGTAKLILEDGQWKIDASSWKMN